MSDSTRALVIVPTYNEASNILPLAREALAQDPSLEFLVVDDASPDGTADLAEKVGADIGGVEVMRRPAKSGLGSAYRDGFRHGLRTGHDVLVEMDSDLSHDPAVLPTLLEGVEQGIGKISEFTSSITSAVEQQNAATGEIARNVQDAAAATQGASESISSVSRAAGESGDAAKQVHRSSGELADQAKLLTGEVDQFLGKLRAS